ncbi:MAG TPA: glycerophosphodiester phosphodiesterase [Tissierellales bacterium]|nr:glycerophosphodiester phosphodiesterase [Tissierellales bacterium]
MNKPLIIAHRGASFYAPENTLISYKKAVEMEADAIEIDVHRSKDGHLVVCHDEKVDRTTNGIGYIRDLNLEEIKKLDAGSWFDEKYTNMKIPLLEEVLQFVKEQSILLNIELKNGPIFYDNIEEDLIRIIKIYKLEEKVLISSFNHYSLLKMKMLAPDIKTGILYIGGMVSPWEYAKKLHADAIHPLFYTINEEIVTESIENGISVNPFTVNGEKELMLVYKFGVSGIITDRPDVAKNIINSVN